MSLRDVAKDNYRTQAALTRSAQRAAQDIWVDGMRPALDASWAGIANPLYVTVSAAQLLAARQAEPYVDAAVAEQGGDTSTRGTLIAASLAGIASDGRSLDTLLFGSVVRSKLTFAAGASTETALATGLASLLRIVSAQVSDAGRVATEVAMTTRPQVQGWVRMLNAPACDRCAILAGEVYRWSDGFLRHPGCGCVHVPSTEEGAADELRTDPRAYFESLPADDQDKYFTEAGAQAIRDGADISQVVNAHRRSAGLSQPGRLTAEEQHAVRDGNATRLRRVDVYGRPLAMTTEGTTRRGVAGQRRAGTNTPRLMPEAIAELAGDDRDERIRLLRRFGYIL
jgi:hypothetical protein